MFIITGFQSIENQAQGRLANILSYFLINKLLIVNNLEFLRYDMAFGLAL